MAEQYAPIAKDSSLNTTDLTPKNIADVLQDGLATLANSVKPTADEIPFDNTGTSLVSTDVEGAIKETLGLIPNVIMSTTLAGDVLTEAKNLPNGAIKFYANSNNPTNKPTNGSWGSYLFIKSNNFCTIFYADRNMFACTYSVGSTDSSITWHIC